MNKKSTLYFATGGQHSRDILYIQGVKDVVSGGPIDATEWLPLGATNDKATNGLGQRKVNFPVINRVDYTEI